MPAAGILWVLLVALWVYWFLGSLLRLRPTTLPEAALLLPGTLWWTLAVVLAWLGLGWLFWLYPRRAPASIRTAGRVVEAHAH